MKIRKILFLILICVMLLSSVLVSPIQAQDDPPPTFGLDIYNSKNVVKVDGDLGEPGNHWVHHNGLMWSEVQPTQSGGFNWNSEHIQKLDAYLEAMNKSDMEVILIIRSTPEWAQLREGYYCGPMKGTTFGAFADFVAAAVRRYSQEPYSVDYYEIWNEPDAAYLYYRFDKESMYGCWGDPGPDENNLTKFFGGDYYGEMLKVVYPKLKAASADAQLIIGGLLLPSDPVEHPDWKWRDNYWPYSNMSKFFEGILKACQGAECFDVVNFHGYTTYKRPFGETSPILMEKNGWFWRDRGGMVEGKLDYLQGLMSKYSVDKPIFITEAAMVDFEHEAEDYDPTFEAAKEDYLVWLFARNIAFGIDATIWHKLDYYGWLQSGLLDKKNEPLPAYEVFHVLTKTLGGTVYNSELNLGEGILGFKFMKGNLWTWVVFSEDGTEKTIAKPPWFSHAYNLLKFEVKQTETTISFDRPIYIDNIPNTTPIFLSNPMTMAIADKPYIYNIITGSAPPENFDIHKITAISSLPSWLTFQDHGDGTAILFGAPRNEDLGKYDIELLVTDSGGLTARQKFTVQVFRPEDILNIYFPVITR